MVNKIIRWIIASAVFVIGLSGFTVYGAPLSSSGSGERTQVKDPVKVVCENGVMLGQSEAGGRRLRLRIQAATKSNVTTSDTQRCSMNGLPNRHPFLLKMKIV